MENNDIKGFNMKCGSSLVQGALQGESLQGEPSP